MHELNVAERRRGGPDSLKAEKDRAQAEFLIAAWAALRPDEARLAHDEVVARGSGETFFRDELPALGLATLGEDQILFSVDYISWRVLGRAPTGFGRSISSGRLGRGSRTGTSGACSGSSRHGPCRRPGGCEAGVSLLGVPDESEPHLPVPGPLASMRRGWTKPPSSPSMLPYAYQPGNRPKGPP